MAAFVSDSPSIRRHSIDPQYPVCSRRPPLISSVLQIVTMISSLALAYFSSTVRQTARM